MKKATKQAGESDTKLSESSTPTPSLYEETEEKQPEKPTKLTVPHSVQFTMPLTVANLSGTLNQVGRSQVLIEPGYFLGFPGVWLRNHDERSKMRTFVPITAWKGISVEEVDSTKSVQS